MFYYSPHPHDLHSFPTRRSSDLSMIDQEGVTQTRYVFAGEGMDYQLSYTFPVSHYEIIGRFSTQNVDDKIYQLNVPNQKQYSLGITKYIWEHAFKIQTEFTYDQMQFHTGEQKGDRKSTRLNS